MSDQADVGLRASALHDAGRPREAIALLQAALAGDPHDPVLLEALARVQLDVDPAEAYETAGRLIALEPDDADAHYLAALASLDVEQGKRALGHAERVAELAPWWAPAHAVLADALARRPGKRKEALAAAHRAIELDPDSIVGYVAAGNVELGHALLRFDPRDAEARSRIDELVWIGIATTTLLVSTVCAIAALATSGDTGAGLAQVAWLTALGGLVSSWIRALHQRRRLRR